jgi:hypothetical protein
MNRAAEHSDNQERSEMRERIGKAAVSAVIAVFCLFSQAGAQEPQRITGADWVGCSSQQHYETLIEIAFGDDEDAFAEMIASGKCFGLRDGAPVTIVEDASSHPGIIAIRGQGWQSMVWTASDAVR